MDLYQMLKLKENKETDTKENKSLIKIIDNRIKISEQYLKIGDFKEKDINSINSIIDNSNIDTVLKVRKNLYKENGKIPKKLRTINLTNNKVYEDQYTILSDLPRANVEDIRKLAEKLSMIIIPITYSHLEELFNLCDNKKELNEKYKIFSKLIKSDEYNDYRLYMLCPINYYSVWEHIKAEENVSMYYPSSLIQIFASINMMIPAQRNMYQSINTNKENMDQMSDAFNSNIKMMDQQLTELTQRMDNAEKELIKQNNKINEVNEKVNNTIKSQQNKIKQIEIKQAQLEKEIYRLLDPIMFAIPKDDNVTTSTYDAIIGLCWGGDIDDNYLAIKGLTKNNEKIDMNKLREPVNKNLDMISRDMSLNTLIYEFANSHRNMFIKSKSKLDICTFINKLIKVKTLSYDISDIIKEIDDLGYKECIYLYIEKHRYSWETDKLSYTTKEPNEYIDLQI